MRQFLQVARDEASAANLTVATAQAAAAAAEQAAERDRDAADRMWRELDEARASAQADRDTLRAEQTEQLRQIQHSTDARVAALETALEVANRATET